MSIPTEENHINGHLSHAGVCRGCRLEVTYTEVALNGVSFALCRRCAKTVAAWLSADVAQGCRQRGDSGADFQRVEAIVTTNLRLLALLGIASSDEELATLLAYAKEAASCPR